MCLPNQVNGDTHSQQNETITNNQLCVHSEAVSREKAKENPARLRSNRGGRREFIASVEKAVDQITGAENGGSYDGIFCIRREEEVGVGRGAGG